MDNGGALHARLVQLARCCSDSACGRAYACFNRCSRRWWWRHLPQSEHPNAQDAGHQNGTVLLPKLQHHHGLLRQIASFGFVVVAFESCNFGARCDNGGTQFVGAVNTLQFLGAHPGSYALPIDFGARYSASGHSTGARDVLMLATIADSPAYLNGTALAPLPTPVLRATVARIACVIADHPDPMSDPARNPDVPGWRISTVPTLVVTAQHDRIEPELSAWADFSRITAPDRTYVNVTNGTHLQPLLSHREGEYVAYWAQFFALGNATAGGLLFGGGAGSLLRRSGEGFTAGQDSATAAVVRWALWPAGVEERACPASLRIAAPALPAAALTSNEQVKLTTATHACHLTPITQQNSAVASRGTTS